MRSVRLQRKTINPTEFRLQSPTNKQQELSLGLGGTALEQTEREDNNFLHLQGPTRQSLENIIDLIPGRDREPDETNNEDEIAPRVLSIRENESPPSIGDDNSPTQDVGGGAPGFREGCAVSGCTFSNPGGFHKCAIFSVPVHIPCQQIILITINDPDDTHLLRCSDCNDSSNGNVSMGTSRNDANTVPILPVSGHPTAEILYDDPIPIMDQIQNPPTRFGHRKNNKTNAHSKKGKR